jgi:hypothetical protein
MTFSLLVMLFIHAVSASTVDSGENLNPEIIADSASADIDGKATNKLWDVVFEVVTERELRLGAKVFFLVVRLLVLIPASMLMRWCYLPLDAAKPHLTDILGRLDGFSQETAFFFSYLVQIVAALAIPVVVLGFLLHKIIIHQSR